MNILFEPKYNIGDVVCLKIDPETKYVIEGYSLKQISAEGEVTFWRYILYNNEGANFFYSELDLQLIERISKQ